ncbi:hypothetical protein PCANC_26427 [Puccinia coronata f. sp. avenae]|uniref:Uncharacterized protein n=1 Tax=Puccinia coronata f. sp. avenae TaxID=200324 RepID=A0A2N5TNU1_9BASI|nr:hypothetical protein PCANC_26427 [Puccinia coronata f. sp. avenae]
MATDFFLEIQNYWLKHFFNHSGIGTQIDWLKDVFSINILIKVKLESGAKILLQSHKNHLSKDSIDSFIRMAHSEKLGQKSNICVTPVAHDEMYASGIAKLQQYYMERKNGLD